MEARENESAARVAAMITHHYEALLRVARAVSMCSDDAHDAVQRALEIYLRRLDSVNPETEVAWLKAVARNEALAVRKGRTIVEQLDPEAHVSLAREPDDHAAGAERVARSAEVLRQLKRDEARALLARSMGMSYREIGERFNWSYTKVNRCVTEGRARFLKLFGEIERGEECARFAPALRDLAAGQADSEQVLAVRPHLRACPACRATVRQLHGTRPSRVAAALALPGKWIAERFAQAKAEAYGATARLAEVAGATPAGGGRGAAATALVGLCLGGAGSYCAATGVFDAKPSRKVSHVAEHAPKRVAIPEKRQPRARIATVGDREPVAPTVTTPAASQPTVAREEPAQAPTGDAEFAVVEDREPGPASPQEFQPAPTPSEFRSPPAAFETAAPDGAAADFETAARDDTAGEFGGG